MSADRPGVPLELAALRGVVERLLAAVEAQTAEIRGLRADVRSLRPAPDDRLAALLPTIHAVLGSDEFAAAWLVDTAMDVIPGTVELLVAIVAIIGRGKPAGRVRRLGHFLARHAGAVAGELRLERVRESRDGAVFKVAQVATPAQMTGNMPINRMLTRGE